MDKKQYRERLDSLAHRKDLIPGIHNYCDRWCERCPFTTKCGNYALTEGFDEDGESKDLQNDKFWNDLHMIFEVTLDMIREKAEEFGIDIENLDMEEDKREVVETDAEKLSKDYSIKITNWLQSNEGILKEKANETLLIKEFELLKLKDSVEVIQWYSIFISAKVHRAFHDLGMDEEEDFEYDRLGSSKIAIIAIDRSIAALGYLLEKIPALEDELLAFLTRLSKVKKLVLNSFPKAMEFKRPGFDD